MPSHRCHIDFIWFNSGQGWPGRALPPQLNLGSLSWHVSSPTYLCLFLLEFTTAFLPRAASWHGDSRKNNTITYCFHFIVNLFNCFSYQASFGSSKQKKKLKINKIFLHLRTPSPVHLGGRCCWLGARLEQPCQGAIV